MNLITKNINTIFIIIFLIFIYIYPSHRLDFILALVFALFGHLLVQHSREYKKLNYIRLPIEKYDEYIVKRKFNKILKKHDKILKKHDKIQEKQEREEFLKELINNALRKIKSTDEVERQIGIEELVALESKDVYTYNELMKIIKDGLPKSHERQILEILCKIYKNINQNNI